MARVVSRLHHCRGSLLVALALAVMIPQLFPSGIGAHAFLVRTTPQAGERLATSPRAVGLQFSEPVSGGEHVVIRRAGGATVMSGPPRRLRDGFAIEAPLPPLDDGVYVASWQALAADGHLAVGEFAFAVGTTEQPPLLAGQGGGPLAWSDMAARWLFLVGLLLAFGALASERFIWAAVGRRHEIVIPTLPVGRLLLLAFAGGVLQFLLLARQSVGVGDESASPAPWASFLLTRPGLLTLGQVAPVAYGLWLLPVRRARAWMLLPLVLAIMVAAVRGHAGTAAVGWAVPASAAHLVAAGLWFGALGHLALVARRLRREELRPALVEGGRRYAVLALGLVALALASGLVVALVQFTQPAELVHTTYGRVLLVKLVLVAATLGLAGAARRSAQPAVVTDGSQLGLLRRLTRAEGVLLLATIVVAGVLAYVPPPMSATAGENLLGPPPLSGPVGRRAALTGRLAVYLAASEGQLQVRVLAPSGDPAFDASVTIGGRAPDGTELEIVPRACGGGCITSAFPWPTGTTVLAVTVTAAEWEGSTATFTMPWPLQPENPALLEQVIETMRAQPRFTIAERVTSGPGAVSEGNFALTGKEFVEGEPYVGGGADDVRPIPTAGGDRALTLYISGSALWFYLEIDSTGRLHRETIVNPGHLIEQTFEYDTGATPTNAASRASPGER